ncbi:NIPSNAP family protein [Ferrovibrio sp.]|uniref:NIPSNAP family protein n=1 Tax=Ferrovibrio sp. TaxID=1917215 RepID=UPI003D28CDE3
MLLDVRTYTCRPGRLKPQLDLYEKLGFAAQKRHLGEPLAFLVTESGALNTYVHIWVYENAGDREKKRAAMLADPEWQAFIAASAAEGNLVAQETKLMNPASFAPIKRS